MSILIVEDNAINAKRLEHFLNTRGYQTIIAKNAIMALATLSPVKEVQLIITDLFSALKYFDHGDIGRSEPPPSPRPDQRKPLPPFFLAQRGMTFLVLIQC
jgi:hypothetical protein